jgi:hypothetical protein
MKVHNSRVENMIRTNEYLEFDVPDPDPPQPPPPEDHIYNVFVFLHNFLSPRRDWLEFR